MELKRVVVTGLGALTPIGNTKDEYWEALISGKSGAGPITYFDAEKFKTKGKLNTNKVLAGVGKPINESV